MRPLAFTQTNAGRPESSRCQTACPCSTLERLDPCQEERAAHLLDLSSERGGTAQSYRPIPAENTAERNRTAVQRLHALYKGWSCRSRSPGRPHPRSSAHLHTRCPVRPPARPHSAAPEVQLLVPLLFVLAVFFDKLPFVLSSSG